MFFSSFLKIIFVYSERTLVYTTGRGLYALFNHLRIIKKKIYIYERGLFISYKAVKNMKVHLSAVEITVEKRREKKIIIKNSRRKNFVRMRVVLYLKIYNPFIVDERIGVLV